MEGTPNVYFNGKMRYRIQVDEKLTYGNKFVGKECKGINLDLGKSKVLGIKTDDGGDSNYVYRLAFRNLQTEY